MEDHMHHGGAGSGWRVKRGIYTRGMSSICTPNMECNRNIINIMGFIMRMKTQLHNQDTKLSMKVHLSQKL